jgi:hypothetical protein
MSRNFSENSVESQRTGAVDFGQIPIDFSRFFEWREPPDLFWWDQMHVSLDIGRQIDLHAMPCVARESMRWHAELSLQPDTTNIKLADR